MPQHLPFEPRPGREELYCQEDAGLQQYDARQQALLDRVATIGWSISIILGLSMLYLLLQDYLPELF